MAIKTLNFLLIISSLFGYLEWGQDNSTFLFQAEYDVIKNIYSNLKSAAHPFTLIPLFGQILLLITLFQKKPSKTLTYLGIICLGLLLGLMFFIGTFTSKFNVLFSTLPFIILSIITIRNMRKT